MAKTSLICCVILAVLPGCSVPPSDATATGKPTLSSMRRIFPDATALREVAVPEASHKTEYADQTLIKEIQGPVERLGYCVDSTVAAKSGPFRIRVLVNSDLTVLQALVLAYAWERGRDVRRPDFTGQFEGKGPEAPLKIGQDIDAMTGATFSSKAMAAGVKDSLTLLENLL